MSDPFQHGYGTETLRIDVLDHGAYADTVARAVDLGYRHLDTSQHAGTEAVVAEALRRSGVDRARSWWRRRSIPATSDRTTSRAAPTRAASVSVST